MLLYKHSEKTKKGTVILKIIHCADLHIDSKMESNFTKAQAEVRKQELFQTFIRMVDFAKENDVRAIIIAGDLFDTSKMQQITIKKKIAYVIGQNPKIDFLYLRGNHDAADFFSTLDAKLPNLKTFNSNWTSYTYDNVVITGRELPNEKISDSVYAELALDSKKINIVTLHGQIARAETKKDAPLIDLRKLENKNINYLALGHIHKMEQGPLGKNGVWCYSGCLEGRGFDECGEKGFMLLDIEDRTVNITFNKIAKRRIEEVVVKLEGSMTYSEIMQKIEAKMENTPDSIIVKIILKGAINDDTIIEPKAYEEQLESKFFLVKVYDETTTAINYEKYRNDISLKGEFVRKIEADTSLGDEEKTKIILTGLRALAGEEIEL